ncbi:MAG: DUF2399 domain-containing protein [Myxococcales bacterium]|nr:DUF2399 domain-containing protein [Myxococcales bacterium]
MSGAGVDQSTLGDLRAAVADAPAARRALAAVLDRAEATGRMPQRITVAVDAPGLVALRSIFSPRAVAALPDGRARLELARVPAHDLAALLYAALDRAPRDPADERRRLDAELQAGLARVPAAAPTATAYLAAVTDDLAGLHTLARDRGPAHALHQIAQVTRALDALATVTEPLRVASFAARALGDSKALGPGTELARAVGDALLRFDPVVQAEVAARQPRSALAAAALALEARGLVRDLTSVLVHVFGPLTYAVGELTFRHVADHAVLGVPTPLSLAQLRTARLVDAPFAQITIFENQAPFLDYLDRADPRRELVVCARGQATWAVVTLVRLCAATGAPIRAACDLDRSGVLILRSLAARAHAPIAPWHMDAATHARFAATAGRPLDPDERDRLARLVAADPPDAPCHDLLRAIHATGLWIEQEAIAHHLWNPPPPHDDFNSNSG